MDLICLCMKYYYPLLDNSERDGYIVGCITLQTDGEINTLIEIFLVYKLKCEFHTVKLNGLFVFCSHIMV